MSYILFTADFDENDSDITIFKTLKDVVEYFDDVEFVDKLLSSGLDEGEWHSYHLINTEEVL